jgi:chromosome segregation ATPase
MDHHKLQEAYTKLEAARDLLLVKLQTKEDTWQQNLTDAEKGANQATHQLDETTGQIPRLTSECSRCSKSKVELAEELDELHQELELLNFRSRTLSVCSMVPLILLMFAILLAFNPFLSWLTVTAPLPHIRQ